ncbi:unnamed protein product [Effrenium voratum]|nr:unnamed protein product [Effrenium voratum]
MKASLRAAGRGGARNWRKEDLDQTALIQAFTQHAVQHGPLSLLQFGPYLGLPTTRAIMGAELVRLSPILRMFLAQIPAGKVKLTCLRTLYIKFCSQHPAVWHFLGTQKSLSDHATDCANTCLTMLAHARRLTDEVKFRQAASGLTTSEAQVLESLRDHFRMQRHQPLSADEAEGGDSGAGVGEVDLDHLSDFLASQELPADLEKRSGTKQVLKRPAQRAPSAVHARKKPAASSADISKEEALRQFPQGCGKCRGKPGCYRSCHKYRGFRLIE